MVAPRDNTTTNGCGQCAPRPPQPVPLSVSANHSVTAPRSSPAASGHAALVAEYWYNGLNYRIAWKYDTDADGDTDANDKKYSFCHDERWRIVATFRESDTDPKERFVWHGAGRDGRGNSSYIDSTVLRHKDANTAFTSASDGTLEECVYFCQNWRADVSAVLKSDGTVLEWVKYSAYGVPFRKDPADYNSSGAINGTDQSDFNTDYNTGNPEADLNFDGFVDGSDSDLFNNAYGSPGSTGRFVLSRASISNRFGYSGYGFDPALIDAHHFIRNGLVYDSTVGRIVSRAGPVSLLAALRNCPVPPEVVDYNIENPTGRGCTGPCCNQDPTASVLIDPTTGKRVCGFAILTVGNDYEYIQHWFGIGDKWRGLEAYDLDYFTDSAVQSFTDGRLFGVRKPLHKTLQAQVNPVCDVNGAMDYSESPNSSWNADDSAAGYTLVGALTHDVTVDNDGPYLWQLKVGVRWRWTATSGTITGSISGGISTGDISFGLEWIASGGRTWDSKMKSGGTGWWKCTCPAALSKPCKPGL